MTENKTDWGSKLWHKRIFFASICITMISMTNLTILMATERWKQINAMVLKKIDSNRKEFVTFLSLGTTPTHFPHFHPFFSLFFHSSVNSSTDLNFCKQLYFFLISSWWLWTLLDHVCIKIACILEREHVFLASSNTLSCNWFKQHLFAKFIDYYICLLYTSPSPRD